MAETCCDAQRRLEQIRVQCIDLIPPVAGQRDPNVWVCRLCGARGEYPGLQHHATCKVEALYVPLKQKPQTQRHP